MRKFVLCLLLLPALLNAQGEKLAFIYYYGWYGNPDWDSGWQHWQEYDHRPPRDVSSAYYPRLGPYSSGSPAILEQHIRWIAGANVNVIIYSWWGRDDLTDRGVEPLMNLATDYGLKVAFLIEPYAGRTTSSICNDIEYLTEKHGKHPAFFKMAIQDTDSTPAKRGVFFLYQPDPFTELELQQLSRRVHNTAGNPAILLQSTDVGLTQRAGADGLFAYEAFQNVQHFYEGLVQTAKQAGLIFIPCVSPGFNINRTMNVKSDIFRARKFGRTFDDWWEQVIASGADYVAIISFNEWHEGTQIEPAAAVSGPGYLSYEGAYKKSGPPAEQSYLRRAARWIQLFQTGSW